MVLLFLHSGILIHNTDDVYFRRLKINHDSHEFILESGTVANNCGNNSDPVVHIHVSRCHRGGRMRNINAWYLNTHMVYL
jgi:hypothetical protein